MKPDETELSLVKPIRYSSWDMMSPLNVALKIHKPCETA